MAAASAVAKNKRRVTDLQFRVWAAFCGLFGGSLVSHITVTFIIFKRSHAVGYFFEWLLYLIITLLVSNTFMSVISGNVLQIELYNMYKIIFISWWCCVSLWLHRNLIWISIEKQLKCILLKINLYFLLFKSIHPSIHILSTYLKPTYKGLKNMKPLYRDALIHRLS